MACTSLECSRWSASLISLLSISWLRLTTSLIRSASTDKNVVCVWTFGRVWWLWILKHCVGHVRSVFGIWELSSGCFWHGYIYTIHTNNCETESLTFTDSSKRWRKKFYQSRYWHFLFNFNCNYLVSDSLSSSVMSLRFYPRLCGKLRPQMGENNWLTISFVQKMF